MVVRLPSIVKTTAKVRFYDELAEQQIPELRTIMSAATDSKP